MLDKPHIPSPAEFRGLRRSLGLTQAEAGAAVGVRRQTVHHWESHVKLTARAVLAYDQLVTYRRQHGVKLRWPTIKL